MDSTSSRTQHTPGVSASTCSPISQSQHTPPHPSQRPPWCVQHKDNMPLLRSANVPLPATSERKPSMVGPPPWAVAVPLASTLRGRNQAIPSCLPPDLFDRLQSEVASQLWRCLVESPEDMPVLSPMGNWPRPEVFFNTAVKRQHSRPCPAARAAPQGLMRLCVGCWSGAGPRGAQCAIGGQCCPGCVRCVGRAFLCPACGVTFERRWVYESGSGIASIGRSPDRFEVFPFTSAQESAAQKLDEAVRLRAQPDEEQVALRSCVQVAYLGAAFCAACALGHPHGSKQCGSVLHMHKDRAGGGNSQAASPNHTLSVGAPRSLRMELRLPHAGVSGLYTTGAGPGTEAQFVLAHGSEFTLEPRDEELLPRMVGDGSIAMGSFFHGMESEVGAQSVSCGLVFRAVTGSAEVDVASNYIIQARSSSHQLETRCLLRGLANQPSWVPKGFKGTRAQALALTRLWWTRHAPVYAAKIQSVLSQALSQWTTADGADRLAADRLCGADRPGGADSVHACGTQRAAAAAAVVAAAAAITSTVEESGQLHMHMRCTLAEGKHWHMHLCIHVAIHMHMTQMTPHTYTRHIHMHMHRHMPMPMPMQHDTCYMLHATSTCSRSRSCTHSCTSAYT